MPQVTAPDRVYQLDPVLLSVLTKRFEAIAIKMVNTLLRTARSGVINNGRDFSCCILTADGQLLTSGESLPVHVMVGADMMACSMSQYHPELRAGDAFLHNSPYHGCSHPADLSVLIPVIDRQGNHRFTVLAKAHQADIGNSIPTTYFATARDIYEEGALIFPAVKVQSEYRDIDDIVRMCKMRIRAPLQWQGDYMASLGAARIAERELLELGDELGWDTLESYVTDWFDYSEERMIAAIRAAPKGQAIGRSTHDAFPGTPSSGIEITSIVNVDPENATIDINLEDNPDCMPCGFNLSEACSRSGALIGVFNSLGSDVPPNAGSFRRVSIALRENCIVGIPVHPASCSVATTNVLHRLINSVQLAMSELGRGCGMAEFGAVTSVGAAVISGIEPDDNSPYVNQLILAETVGAASPAADGWLTLVDGGAAGLCMYDSVEVDELRHPIHIAGRGIVADSEGAGEFRGAPSAYAEYGPTKGTMRVVSASDGIQNPPKGACGGGVGGAASNFRRNSNRDLSELGNWVDITISEGEFVRGISCGGGGYGSPLARDPKRVKHDVDEGYISVGRAASVYGVILSDTGAIDEQATFEQRRLLQAGPCHSS